MSSGGVHYRVPGNKRGRLPIAPTTRLGKWSVGLVTATVVVLVTVITVVPGDSLAAWMLGLSGLVLFVAGGAASFGAVQRGDRGLSVYAAAFVLIACILFLLLHSLFISD